MGLMEELAAFAAANGITKTDGKISLDKEKLDTMIENFVAKTGGEKLKGMIPKEKLQGMIVEGRDLLKTMIKEMNPNDASRTFAEDILKKTAKFMPKETSEEAPEKIFISWEELNAITTNVAPKILKKFPNIDTILCVTRGGLVPAGILAYALGIKNIVNIKVESYSDENTQKGMKLTKLSKRDIRTLEAAEGILIVDDILDTGDTVTEVYEYLDSIGGDELVEKTEFFSIVTKDYTIDEFCVYNLTGDERWIVFPWDV